MNLPFKMNTRRGRLVFIALAAACSDGPGPTGPVCSGCVPDPGPIISNPTQATGAVVAASVASGAGAGAGDSVVYVSLAPGSEVEGSIATVRLLSSLSSVTTAIADGGFDPVPLNASDEDSVEVFVRDVAGTVLLHTVSQVVRARRPVVVRANPPPRKRDVPLNSVIVTVFSEPVAAGSLTPGSVRLLQGSVAVPGSVRLLAGTATGVAFVPNSPLRPNTTYRLQVTSAVRDLDGESLAATVESDFTTGTTTIGPVTYVNIHPDSADVAVGSQFQLGVTARDSAGDEIVGHPVVWASCDLAVLSVSATGLATALAEGYACVTADIDGVQGSTIVNVSAALTPVADVDVTPDSARLLVGDSVQLTIDARDSLGLPIDRRVVVWTSTDPAVAAVVPVTNQSVLVRGLASGTALIVGRIEGKSDTSIVRVGTIGAIVDLVLSPPRASLVAQDTVRLTAFGRDAQGFVQELNSSQVIWSSSNNAVATVTAAGLVTGRAPDSATISGTWNGRRGTASIAVIQLSFASISVGGGYTCGIVQTGATYCWGYGWDGQLGTGSLGWFPWPTAVAGGLRFVELDAGFNNTCALDHQGVAYCWGLRAAGPDRCSNGGCDLAPAAVAGGLRFASLKVGGGLVCGLTANHATYCWRYYEPTAPTLVDSGLAFSSITAGASHACGVTSAGTAYCWGSNYGGQLGTGDTTSRSEVPLRVADTLSFTLLSAAETHTCGLTTGGATYCWGTPSAYGVGGSRTPAPVMNGVTFTTLSGALYSTCGLLANGSIQCWDDWGPSASRQPWTVPGTLVFTRLSVGGFGHACAITVTDVAYCWGNNNQAQLGIGTIDDFYHNPTKVGGQP